MSRPGLAAATLVVAGMALVRTGVSGWRRAPARTRSLRESAPTGGALSRNERWKVATPAWVAPCLARAGLSVDPDRAWSAWLVGTATATVLAQVGAGPGAAALALAVAGGGPLLGWRVLRHRGTARLEAALPAAVEAVAAGLRSGASLRQALAEAAGTTPGDLGSDLLAVATATERGAGLVPALEAWAERRPLPGVRLVVAALCLGAETGGATARAVDAVAATLRQRLAAQAEAQALATQARVSAAVIAVAPLAFCALSAATDPRAATFLLRTPLGLILLAAGLVLDGVGALWMARIARTVA